MTLSGPSVAVQAALPVGCVSGTGSDPPSLLGAPLTARPRLPPAVPSGLVAPTYGSCTGTPAPVFSAIAGGNTSSTVVAGSLRVKPAAALLLPRLFTVNVRGAVVYCCPEVSVTTAVSSCWPLNTPPSGSRLFHTSVYGEAVTGAPTCTPSIRKATPATPRSSLAVADSVTSPLTVAPAAGALSEPVGMALLSTVTRTAVGVVVWLPASSVARTVMSWAPLATDAEFQLTSNGTALSTRKSTRSTRRSSSAEAARWTVPPVTVLPAPGVASDTRGPCATLPSV